MQNESLEQKEKDLDIIDEKMLCLCITSPKCQDKCQDKLSVDRESGLGIEKTLHKIPKEIISVKEYEYFEVLEKIATCENLDKYISIKYSEIDKLNKIIEVKKAEIESLGKPFSKGYYCSKSGNLYEKEIYDIVKRCTFNGKPFNTQIEEELAGSSSRNDIECNFINVKDIGIEAKKFNTPDWMQCSIKYNNDGTWSGVEKSKIPIKSREIFNNVINDINLYDGEIPPFFKKQITHEEWVQIKKKTHIWNDKYIDIPCDTISRLYKAKGCHYIQISDGYGLYHLGDDKCELRVPLFNIKQQLRIRIKVHTRKNKKGFCNLSVTISCQPKQIKDLVSSQYSLDNKDKLPPTLFYNIC